MRKLRSNSIIAKDKPASKDMWLVAILLLGSILRLFHISHLTEFLGDQGRTSIILHNWLHNVGPMPLVGPTTLTGQFLGPAFYFLLAPFYVLGGFTPLGAALGMVCYGIAAIYLLYIVVKLVYGVVPARCMALLFAVSPIIARADRIIWEPNLVPFFGLLFAYFAIRQHERINFWDNVGLGAAVGILIQLHYPNLFFLGLSGLLFIGHSIRVRDWGTVIQATFGWIAGFLVVLIPFLMYESAHNFADITQILNIIHTGSVGLGKRQALMYAVDYGGRVFGLIIPFLNFGWVVALMALWVIFLIIQFTAWNIFWTCWFGIGLLIIARYNGVVYDHYLLFLLPPVLLAMAAVIKWLQNKSSIIGWICVLLVIVTAFVQLGKTDMFTAGSDDLERTRKLADAVIEDAQGDSISFTLTASRSFSDLHFRYYFLKRGLSIKSVLGETYKKFYVVCDNFTCPMASELVSQPLQILCFEPHCEGEYPKINLTTDFVFEKTMRVPIDSEKIGLVHVFVPR